MSTPNTLPRISVIIVAWRSREEILACVRSIPGGLGGGAVEVVVVDNSLNADGTADLLAREAPQVRCLVPAENLGFGRGNNLGFRETTGEQVLFLNPDTVCNAAALSRLGGAPRKRLTVPMVGDWLRGPNEDACESPW